MIVFQLIYLLIIIINGVLSSSEMFRPLLKSHQEKEKESQLANKEFLAPLWNQQIEIASSSTEQPNASRRTNDQRRVSSRQSIRERINWPSLYLKIFKSFINFVIDISVGFYLSPASLSSALLLR